MPRITYVGPLGEVEIPTLGVVCEHGKSVEVPEDAAEALLEQTDNWQPTKASKKGDDK